MSQFKRTGEHTFDIDTEQGTLHVEREAAWTRPDGRPVYVYSVPGPDEVIDRLDTARRHGLVRALIDWVEERR